MNSTPIRTKTSTLDIYIKLAQYPILADQIRVRMREELFSRGIISQTDFEEEVRQKAIESQRREGVYDPFNQEPANIWQERKARIRAFQTDFYFAMNMTTQLFEQIVQEVLSQQPTPPDRSLELTFNPELAPWDMLFRQGQMYEKLPPNEREKVAHHLEEIKVVLIKGMISDQLPYIGIAKQVFTIEDLQNIYMRRIGRGKIGGKAAGMLLAWKILQQQSPEFGPDISDQIGIPESYFIATEVIYDFRPMNKLDQFMNQKYRSIEEIRAEYPKAVAAHMAGSFPEKIVDQLREVLREVGDKPLIVRSSSLLEDNFGYSFAGKYESYFCPNQGTPEENLAALLEAIRRVYASTLSPDAILYRQKHGLIDYDERMAILLQCLRGERYGRYFFPTIAGVGFSHNPFRWHPKIRREDGFLRIVWGLGTRAVDRVDTDYPRLVSLSHPQLRPETSAHLIRQYSQHYIDFVDLEANEVRTLPVQEVMKPDYPYLRFIASVDEGEFMQRIVSAGTLKTTDDLVLTFDPLLQDRKFIKLMRTALQRLEQQYRVPVDVEFTVEVIPNYPYPDYRLHILQCRPLSLRKEGGTVEIPSDIPEKDILFTGTELIPDGRVEAIRYIIYVDPQGYKRLDQQTKLEIGRAIGRLNRKLESERFILMGPGRWGSSNIDLGVKVSYADIYNTKVLVEMGVVDKDRMPELSYGTHFFQDLVEAGIHPLPLYLDGKRSRLDWSFFQEAPNLLAQLSPQDTSLAETLVVVDVSTARPGHRLNVLMDGTHDKAIGYFLDGQWSDGDANQANIGSF